LGFQGDFTLRNLLENLILINFPLGRPHITSVAWTLFIEAIFYGFIAVVINYQRRHPLTSTLFLLIPPAAMAVLNQQTTLLPTLRIPNLTDSTPFVAILALGRSLYFLHQTSLPKHQVIATSLMSFLTFALTYSLQWRGKLIPETLSTYYIGILIFLVFMHWPNFQTPGPLRYIANTSYSIYLLHIPIGCLVLAMMTPWTPFGIAFLATCGIMLLICSLTYRWIEVPCQSLGRQLIRRIQPSLSCPAEGVSLKYVNRPSQ
jgi:peptidoglycan/LPS O-acetylase OafA/YrhL